MNLRTRLTLLAIVLLVIGSSLADRLPAAVVLAENRESIEEQTDVPFSSSSNREANNTQESNKRDAKRGDIATGAVLTSPDGELHLNIKPCDVQPFVVIFREPYNRSTRGQKTCAGQNVTIEQIQQN